MKLSDENKLIKSNENKSNENKSNENKSNEAWWIKQYIIRAILIFISLLLFITFIHYFYSLLFINLFS